MGLQSFAEEAWLAAEVAAFSLPAHAALETFCYDAAGRLGWKRAAPRIRRLSALARNLLQMRRFGESWPDWNLKRMPEQRETVPDHVNDNIEAVLEMRAKSERLLRRDQRAIEALTDFIGQPRTLYVLFIGVVGWTSYNHWLASSGRLPFDPPPFFWLQGVIALYASVMTTIVLTTQSRQNKEAARHAHFELQVNLLAEQRTAKIIALLEELRRDLPNVRNRIDPVADALQQAVPPAAVDTAIDHTMNPGARESGTAPRENLPSTDS